MTIQLRLKDGYTPYRIAKELNRPINSVLNEIRRGTVDQIKLNQRVQIYLADAFLNCKLLKENWSIDSCVGYAVLHKLYKPCEMVCTRTLYSYTALGLLPFSNMDLPLVLKRSAKSCNVRKHKKYLGKSIDERPDHIETREEFGHWEIDTVIGKKTKDDQVLLTLVERQTRNAIFLKIPDKTSAAVSTGLLEIREFFGSKFSQVFKTITSEGDLSQRAKQLPNTVAK